MADIKKRSPSRARYAAAHPSITIHFDLETHSRLVALRDSSGQSLNQLVRQALGALERHVETILEQGRRRGAEEGRTVGYREGLKAGYAKAVAMYRLTYPCSTCHRPLEILPGEDDARRVLSVLADEEWGHQPCPD